MKLRSILALAVALAGSPAFAQVNPGTSPLSGLKGGTNNGFMQFSGPASSVKTYTLPNASGTIALLNQVQTWTAAQTFATLNSGPFVITSASSGCLAGGPNGATNPVFLVDCSTASQVAGLRITGAVTTGRVDISTTDSAANSSLGINAKGTGDISLAGTSTGIITLARATTISGALTYGGTTFANTVTGSGSLVGATSPVFVTPALGTPASGVGTNLTGTAAGLTAGNVTTNANMTGAVTSVGNAASLGSFSSAALSGALTDETGSGAAVFATSPVLVTPTLGAATATSIAFSPTTGGIIGTGTNDNAGAGKVGEYVSSIIGNGTPVSLTTSTNTNITSISLTAGDWDVWGMVSFTPAATTNTTEYITAINTVSATLPGLSNPDKEIVLGFPSAGNVIANGDPYNMPPMITRFSLSTTTTVFLIGRAAFTVSTQSAFGHIQARRVR